MQNRKEQIVEPKKLDKSNMLLIGKSKNHAAVPTTVESLAKRDEPIVKKATIITRSRRYYCYIG